MLQQAAQLLTKVPANEETKQMMRRGILPQMKASVVAAAQYLETMGNAATGGAAVNKSIDEYYGLFG